MVFLSKFERAADELRRTSDGPGRNLLPVRLQAEAERADGGRSPADILWDQQQRQNASLDIETMPGPEAWGDYELPLPGTPQARQDLTVKGDPLTPQHSACEGAEDAAEEAGPGEAERRRQRVQHQAEPYPAAAPEVAHADLGKLSDRAAKAYRDAPSIPWRPGEPHPGVPDPGLLARDAEPMTPSRHPLITDGHAATSPGHDRRAR